jgi:hypothetical protein
MLLHAVLTAKAFFAGGALIQVDVVAVVAEVLAAGLTRNADTAVRAVSVATVAAFVKVLVAHHEFAFSTGRGAFFTDKSPCQILGRASTSMTTGRILAIREVAKAL